MEVCAPLGGRAAIEKEAEAFARIAKTQAAASLVQIFLNDQLLKKKFKAFAKQTTPITQAAVLGAGIMGDPEEHTSELQSLMRISYAVFCLKNKNRNLHNT